jgi:hypothetical protein
MDLKIGGVDYVRPLTNPAKFGPFRISGCAPARGWNVQVVWLFFSFFLFSNARADQTRRSRRAQNGSKYADPRTHSAFWGQNFLPQRFGGLLAPKPPKMGPRIGFSMQMKMLNISKTVGDRNMILSANPTKSGVANSRQLKLKFYIWP